MDRFEKSSEAKSIGCGDGVYVYVEKRDDG